MKNIVLHSECLQTADVNLNHTFHYRTIAIDLLDKGNRAYINLAEPGYDMLYISHNVNVGERAGESK